MLKQRGRITQSGSVDIDILAEYEYPVFMRNKLGTAWISQWIYSNGGVPEYRVKAGITKAAATPDSATDGVSIGMGD